LYFALAFAVVLALAFAIAFLVCHPRRGSAFVFAVAFLSPTNPPTVISTGVAHSLIVSSVAEKSAFYPYCVPAKAHAFALAFICSPWPQAF
jgi:hypothetical protein